MKTDFIKKRGNVIAIVSILFLILLCMIDVQKAGAKAAKTPTDALSEQAYEHYKEASIKLQKEFDQFTDTIFIEEVQDTTIGLHYMLANPAQYGIETAPITFGDPSVSSMKNDIAKFKKWKLYLDNLDSQQLTDSQLLTYRILSNYIGSQLALEGFELYAEPLVPTTGVQAQLPVLLAEYAFYNKNDIENYLALLSGIDEYYAQLIVFEQEKSSAGLFMSDHTAEQIIKSCDAYLLTPEHSFLTETFSTRLDTLPDLTAEERTDYITRNRQILIDDFFPAYQILIDGLQKLKGSGVNFSGLCGLPEGKKYYEYLVASNVATSYTTISDLKKAIQKKMDADFSVLSTVMKENPETLSQLDSYTFRLTDPNEILDSLQKLIQTDFPPLPESSYTVKYVPSALERVLSPAFYLVPPLDHYQENTIYINGSDSYDGTKLYPTLAHEGYPGHLYQSVYFMHNNKALLRNLLSYESYSEGWASYVENYCYSYNNGLTAPMKKLLAHNDSATLAIHALLDININYYGWGIEETKEYLTQFFNISGNNIAEDMYYSMIENPTNYLKYYVGYLEFYNMQTAAKKALGDAYDAKEFHKFILDIGPAPFDLIHSYLKSWLLTSKLQ